MFRIEIHNFCYCFFTAWAIKCFTGNAGDFGVFGGIAKAVKTEKDCGDNVFQCSNSTTGALDQEVTTFNCGTANVNLTVGCTKSSPLGIDTNACICNSDLCNSGTGDILAQPKILFSMLILAVLMMKQ